MIWFLLVLVVALTVVVILLTNKVITMERAITDTVMGKILDGVGKAMGEMASEIGREHGEQLAEIWHALGREGYSGGEGRGTGAPRTMADLMEGDNEGDTDSKFRSGEDKRTTGKGIGRAKQSARVQRESGESMEDREGGDTRGDTDRPTMAERKQRRVPKGVDSGRG